MVRSSSGEQKSIRESHYTHPQAGLAQENHMDTGARQILQKIPESMPSGQLPLQKNAALCIYYNTKKAHNQSSLVVSSVRPIQPKGKSIPKSSPFGEVEKTALMQPAQPSR